MCAVKDVPSASLLRLSRYHCYVGGRLRTGDGGDGRITSQRIAADLGVSEEAVRRDLAHIDADGRPGAGYDPGVLYRALSDFLELSDRQPFAAVGRAEMLSSLATMFPAEQFGLVPIAYFSEEEGDAGRVVNGIEVRAMREIDALADAQDVRIALVACAPQFTSEALQRLHDAGVNGALMLTPVLDSWHPEGMNVTFFRIPCTLKSLACAAVASDARCDACCSTAARPA